MPALDGSPPGPGDWSGCDRKAAGPDLAAVEVEFDQLTEILVAALLFLAGFELDQHVETAALGHRRLQLELFAGQKNFTAKEVGPPTVRRDG